MGIYSKANLRQTVYAMVMIGGALYDIGLCISKSIVDNTCDAAEVWKYKIENDLEIVFGY